MVLLTSDQLEHSFYLSFKLYFFILSVSELAAQSRKQFHLKDPMWKRSEMVKPRVNIKGTGMKKRDKPEHAIESLWPWLWGKREWRNRKEREERTEGTLNGWWQMGLMEGAVGWKGRVCVPVGPVCLGSLVLVGCWQSGSVFMRVRVCVHVWVSRRVGGARGALRGRVVRVGGWRATVVQTMELIHLFICRLCTKMETERMSHPPLSFMRFIQRNHLSVLKWIQMQF